METYKTLDESFSSPHLGCQILSYSKRLMNKVMCLADDHGINIYYTDTDSIHIDEAGVEPLAKLYLSCEVFSICEEFLVFGFLEPYLVIYPKVELYFRSAVKPCK